MTRSALLLGCSLLAGCATATGGRRALQQHGAVDLQGSLVLTDGTPVGGAALTLRCGAVEQSALTDEGGRFVLRQLPEGDCWLRAPAAGLSTRVRARTGLLGARLSLRLPPMHRVGLEWREGNRNGSLFLDETVPHALRVGSRRLALLRGALVVTGSAPAAASVLRKPLGELHQGVQLQAGSLSLTVSSVEKRPWIPLALRRSAAGSDELSRLSLISQDGQLVRPVLGVRTLILAGTCEQLRVEILDELEALAATHDKAGLRTLSILTEACPARRHTGQVLLGGPETLWALGTRPGEVAILDGAARSLRRLGSLDEARAYLQRSWPAFAAASKVSVAPSTSVLEAEAERLLAQARAKEKAGKHGEAHQLLDQALRVTPDLAEARKERALIKAKLGDLSGAMREVTWWRTSFGADAADDLLEEVERTARVSLH